MTAMTADTAPQAANRERSASRGLVWRALALLALPLLVASYFAPIWWVALKAPNYPEHTFPDGIRINFHIDSVRNGCAIRTSAEVTEKQALDCLHEMDTINHFVGMFPIAAGGPVEKVFSPFLFTFMGLLIIGFVIPNDRWRLGVLGLGFATLATWMTLTMYAPEGIKHLGPGYIQALVTSLGADESAVDESLHPIVRQLKESLAKSGIAVESAAPLATGGKLELIEALKNAYERDQQRLPSAERKPWTGSAMQVFAWHYEKSLGRWFNQPERNGRYVAIMTIVAHALFVALLAGMALFLVLARDHRSSLFWLLAIVPMLLPVAFVAEYSAWLWWYGHRLNEMGAFTLKPFMPTVFGQGKVAQFTTLSYPHYGFALMAGVGGLLAVAALMRRRQGDM